MTPFEAVYGCPPPSISNYIPGSTSNGQVEQELLQRDAILCDLKLNIKAAQNRMKIQHDRRHSELTFQVGEMVYLLLQPYHQNTTARHSNQRLAARFFGPYKILERIGQVAYKLELPADSQLLPVFHDSLLKKYVGQGVIVQTNLPAIAVDETVNLLLAEILDHCWVKQGKKIVHEVLIRWAHLPVEGATWENLLRLRQAFPTYDLEDKVGFEGGRMIRNQPSCRIWVES
ncbi:hypothetical protein AAC387_Pa01g3099 [Persea americana]